MTAVKYFNSSMSESPTLSNTAGLLIGVLDACLVNGFGSVTLTSLVVAGNVATATVNGGHTFAMVGETGPVLTIEGATPSGLNGEWRVTVTSTTVFMFATTGISDQIATGTITAKRSPAGFSKVYSGTNKAVYRSDNISGNRLYLRVDDTSSNSCRIRGYETMSDVDTGTGLFPTEAQFSGGLYIYKATGSSRPWALISDGKAIYFHCDPTGNSTWPGGFSFGDLIAFKSVDPYATMIVGSVASTGTYQIYLIDNSSGSYLARSYKGVGTSITHIRYSHNVSSNIGSGGQSYGAPTDFGMHLAIVDCWESSSIRRGIFPGLYNPLISGSSQIVPLLIVEGAAGLSGRTIVVCYLSSYAIAYDITGPWR